MGRLRDHSFRITYGPTDDRLHQFYLPALSASVRYDRSAGFFSSDALALVAQGVARLVAGGGIMRLLVGAKLDPDDVDAIKKGHELESRLAQRMLTELTHLEEEIVRRRLEVLAWMIGAGTLTIKVVLPTDTNGRPLPCDQAQDYYHPKAGVFTDAWGDKVAFNGSINESVRGWIRNYEQFAVYRSWDESRPYLLQEVYRFNRLWDGQEPDWVALSVPQAVQEKLLELCPSQAPWQDPLELVFPQPPEAEETKVICQIPFPDQKERLLFQFVRDAPFLPNASSLGLATCAITPWPHQVKVVEALLEGFPERFLLGDEVGLGKTIEAGLVLRQLVLSGRIKRTLILAPKSICKQWQEELYEKFLLNVPLYDGQLFTDYHGRVYAPGKENPWDEFPFMLASSQLAKRRDRSEQLLSASPWDLVLVDEAHHARRTDFLSDRYRPNRLLELLRGGGPRPGLMDRTQGLLLMTATPMQINPVEVWDLLKLLELSGRWGAHEENFLRYFQELRQDFEEVNWNLILDLLRDYFEAGGPWDEEFSAAAEAKLGPVTWEQLKNLPFSAIRNQILKQLSPLAQRLLLEFARRHTPVHRYVWRNTRALLRKYHERGLLKDNVPRREPELVWITMRADEAELYRRVEEYISDFYQKFEEERKGLGFIMTVYRRRLTSSFYALEMSLKRRLEFITGKPQTDTAFGLADDDLEQDDLDFDISEAMEAGLNELARREVEYVSDFLRELKGLTTESKVERLLSDLSQILKRRETVIIFTQYTDTMDYLRELLLPVYGSQVACYSGRGGERWDGTLWKNVTKEVIKVAFKEGEEIKILLCTEAASEGLNLQTCGVLINYDMPWNPMRVEQRIGRIDRIGQVHKEVWIKNYFYEDTVEAAVYQRLEDRISWFQEVVGELQPILSRIGSVIQAAALTSKEARKNYLEQEINKIREELKVRQVAGLNLDELASQARITFGSLSIPITLKEMAVLFLSSVHLRPRFKPHDKISEVYELEIDRDRVLVTFTPVIFDQLPQTVKLLSYGDELFAKLIEATPVPEESSEPMGIVRCQINHPIPCYAHYGWEHGHPVMLETFEAFKAHLEKQDWQTWSTDDLETIKSKFLQHIEGVGIKLFQAERGRLQAEKKAVEEEARKILIEVALVYKALQMQEGLFADDLPVGSLERVVADLKRFKFPFAPLLLRVKIGSLGVPSDFRFFHKIQYEPPKSLQKRIEGLKSQATNILGKLSQAQPSTQKKNYAPLKEQIDVKIFKPPNYPPNEK